ncbi:hypothetical protein QAD02_010593 [Eretmocerus hayati]|uniref:Uncharacterized protein n=1 Tax=Eretmocerus hayati TaxID=131215 RepID=A0ACC2NUP3_9HYME|nr:hypothetical protein QAD02_010593 [Eretmocerus hayati]
MSPPKIFRPQNAEENPRNRIIVIAMLDDVMKWEFSEPTMKSPSRITDPYNLMVLSVPMNPLCEHYTLSQSESQNGWLNWRERAPSDVNGYIIKRMRRLVVRKELICSNVRYLYDAIELRSRRLHSSSSIEAHRDRVIGEFLSKFKVVYPYLWIPSFNCVVYELLPHKDSGAKSPNA